MLSSLGPVGFARIAFQHAPAFACQHGGFAALSALQHFVGRWLGVRGAHALGTVLDQMLPAATSTNRGGIKQFFERAETRQTPTSILGRLVFWLVFIIAIVMATDALGISQVSAVLAELIAY